MDLEILDQFRSAGSVSAGTARDSSKSIGAAGRRVEPHGRHRAVQVSGRVGDVQVEVGVQEGLDRVGSGPELAQAVDREDRRVVVEHRHGAAAKLTTSRPSTGGASLPV